QNTADNRLHGSKAMTNRVGEHGTVPERSGRFLQKEGYWYYSTREGVDIGPFDSRVDAEVSVSAFIDIISASEPKVLAALKHSRAAWPDDITPLPRVLPERKAKPMPSSRMRRLGRGHR